MSGYNPSDNTYIQTWDDAYYVFFWVVVFTGARAATGLCPKTDCGMGWYSDEEGQDAFCGARLVVCVLLRILVAGHGKYPSFVSAFLGALINSFCIQIRILARINMLTSTSVHLQKL